MTGPKTLTSTKKGEEDTTGPDTNTYYKGSEDDYTLRSTKATELKTLTNTENGEELD